MKLRLHALQISELFLDCAGTPWIGEGSPSGRSVEYPASHHRGNVTVSLLTHFQFLPCQPRPRIFIGSLRACACRFLAPVVSPMPDSPVQLVTTAAFPDSEVCRDAIGQLVTSDRFIMRDRDPGGEWVHRHQSCGIASCVHARIGF